MKRTLLLRKETLAELTPAELAAVAAGCVPTAAGLTCVPETMTFCPDYYCTGTI